MAPLLKEAGCAVSVLLTERQGHASELARGLDLSAADAALIVSGDGLLSEVHNGLRAHPAGAAAAFRLPLGVIPAGTGNAVAKSLLHAAGEACSPLSAVLAFLSGQRLPLDILEVRGRVPSGGPSTDCHCLLSVSWGLIADIDIESETMRCCGALRFTLQGLVRVVSPRHYQGRLLFLPLQSDTAAREAGREATAAEAAALEDLTRWRPVPGILTLHVTPWAHVVVALFCRPAILPHTSCLLPSSLSLWLCSTPLPACLPLSFRVMSAHRRSASASAGASGSQAPTDTPLAPNNGNGSGRVNDCGWRVLEGPFEGLWAMNLAFGSETVRAAPRAESADGAVDLVVFKRPSRGSAPYPLLSPIISIFPLFFSTRKDCFLYSHYCVITKCHRITHAPSSLSACVYMDIWQPIPIPFADSASATPSSHCFKQRPREGPDRSGQRGSCHGPQRLVRTHNHSQSSLISPCKPAPGIAALATLSELSPLFPPYVGISRPGRSALSLGRRATASEALSSQMGRWRQRAQQRV